MKLFKINMNKKFSQIHLILIDLKSTVKIVNKLIKNLIKKSINNSAKLVNKLINIIVKSYTQTIAKLTTNN